MWNAGLKTREMWLSQNSYIAPIAVGQVQGFGWRSYELGLIGLVGWLSDQKPNSNGQSPSY